MGETSMKKNKQLIWIVKLNNNIIGQELINLGDNLQAKGNEKLDNIIVMIHEGDAVVNEINLNLD